MVIDGLEEKIENLKSAMENFFELRLIIIKSLEESWQKMMNILM